MDTNTEIAHAAPERETPTPHFTPTPGRQVLVLCTPGFADMLNRTRVSIAGELVEVVTETNLTPGRDSFLNVADLIENAQRAKPVYIGGDRLPATILYVHKDGTCDLALAEGNYPLYGVRNGYGPLEYLYFNQIPAKRVITPTTEGLNEEVF